MELGAMSASAFTSIMWNPVKELKVRHQLELPIHNTQLPWNPVKELKECNSRIRSECVNNHVESGEGIESLYCPSKTQKAEFRSGIR